MLEDLKREVFESNLGLVRHGLAILAFGNVSGMDRAQGLLVIKPSGVPYNRMKPEDLVVVDLKGKVVEGKLRPSSDTPTHIELYKAWPGVRGVCHTHSPYATAFAQACLPVPCLGTTHADHFHGPVPVTRRLSEQETRKNYEANTGKLILELFAAGPRGRLPPKAALDPRGTPAALVACHGPFSWGKSAEDALTNAVLLEEVAEIACKTLLLNPKAAPLPNFLLEKHFSRKHGPKATYGQKK